MEAEEQQTQAQQKGFSFVNAEHEVLRFWQEHETFHKSLEQTKTGDPYTFYDGPPFATGLPHHGSLTPSTIKDVVPRFFTMKGRHVQRRFGWDCHGLPIEQEIDKALGISSREAVARLGVAGYNRECRAIVQRYTGEWQKTITRLGRWVDFENDYKTMEPWYMESVWWVVRQLWDRNYIYEGVKVVPFSTALGTVLSNFEAGSNYQDVQDPAITVLFKLQDEDTWIAAWTTTPWTLPSNLALCVGDDIEYVKVRDHERQINIILAEARLEALSKGAGKQARLEVLQRLKGCELVGNRYEPMFRYFADYRSQGAFVIVSDDYVSTESGTGVVHQAPAFGEDDLRILQQHGIDALVCPLDMAGRFTDEVTDFTGLHVKAADKPIIRHLKNTGHLYTQDVITHSYPFCPRSDTPIIYRTIPSWYVRVEPMRQRLVASNNAINWVPDHIQQGRMGNWLSNAIDWSISRNRYWGTPLPIWRNDVTGSLHCIGSREELQQLTGFWAEDLHREFVDELTFTRPGEAGTYRRIEEVLDCWFESGSMPYAQLHYPFENQSLFERGFPAEFIAEGLDQTRGWFYTLIVLGTALFDKAPFNNVIVNGIVMAEDGKKMSKRLRNYTPPDQLMETYGADALRLYLISSGLARAEEQKFANSGVKEMVRRVLLPWLHAWQFLHTYAEADGWQPATDQGDSKPEMAEPPLESDLDPSDETESARTLDWWILSRLESLKADIDREMAAYRLYKVVPALLGFIEDLTNWYIRLNRGRFWAEGLDHDKRLAYSTLYRVIRELTLSMAPFAPFLAEHIYRQLQLLGGEAESPESVHLCRYPEAQALLIRPDLEQAVSRLKNIILLGRQKRNQIRIKTRTPLARLTIIHEDRVLLNEIALLQDHIRDELNVKEIKFTSDEGRFINLYAKTNARVLGKRLGKNFKRFKAMIEGLDRAQLKTLQEAGEITLEGERFSAGDEQSDIRILREARPGTDTLSDRFISIDVDCRLTDDLIQEGLAREVVNRVQKTRKEMAFHVADRIYIRYRATAGLTAAIRQFRDYICRETLALEIREAEPAQERQDFEVDDQRLTISLLRVRQKG